MSVTLSLTSESFVEGERGDIIYISCLVNNSATVSLDDVIRLTLPDEWVPIPADYLAVSLAPGESVLKIFGVKISDLALAGNYAIAIQTDRSKERLEVTVKVTQDVDLRVELLSFEDRYLAGESSTLNLVCINKGNTCLKVEIVAKTDPICQVTFPFDYYEIEPGETVNLSLQMDPSIAQVSYQQHLLLKVIDVETSQALFVRAVNFEVIALGSSFNDPFIRIPAHTSLIALGDNSDKVFAIEVEGQGYVDVDEDRFLDFSLRLPTKTQNVIYNVNQRLFLGLDQPGLDVCVGDTVYVLSPLTQRYRYGRGGGLDIDNGNWSFGSHYTQNTFTNSYNPRESCAYANYSPSPCFNISCNYLHKTLQHTPTSNIATCSAEIEFPKNTHTEMEFGKNFISQNKHKDTLAYRFATRGKCFKDAWFDIEKVYAGAAFFGYYQHINAFSTTLDFPLSRTWRSNLSYNDLKQNFNARHQHYKDTLVPHQKQFVGNFSYSLCSGTNVMFNTMLLRAKDDSRYPQYNFYQKWGGAAFTFTRNRYYLNASVQFGQQNDYLTHQNSQFLQKYYIFLGKDITHNLNASFFYEGGSTNYYDAKPWRTSLGAALLFRRSERMNVELMAQHVVNKPDQYEMNQVSARCRYTFKNLSQLQGTVQYFNYKSNYPNDFLFLISYTVPFGLPVAKRRDMGVVEGYVYDAWRKCPISDAMVNLNGKTALTDIQGKFAFPKVPVGAQCLRAEILPRQTILQEPQDCYLHVQSGVNHEVSIPVVPPCSISGQVTLYVYDDFYESFTTGVPSRLVEKGGLESLRVFIDRDNGKEIYTCLTDEQGQFEFNFLRPGKWEVTIQSDYLPTWHKLNQQSFVFEMEPEQDKHVTFKVYPEEVRISPLN